MVPCEVGYGRLAQNAGSGEGSEDVPITLNKLLARLLVQA
jgi:hypothetical protein